MMIMIIFAVKRTCSESNVLNIYYGGSQKVMKEFLFLFFDMKYCHNKNQCRSPLFDFLHWIKTACDELNTLALHLTTFFDAKHNWVPEGNNQNTVLWLFRTSPTMGFTRISFSWAIFMICLTDVVNMFACCTKPMKTKGFCRTPQKIFAIYSAHLWRMQWWSANARIVCSGGFSGAILFKTWN